MSFDSANSVKITDLPQIGGALTGTDIFPVVDTASGQTKSVDFDEMSTKVKAGLNLNTGDVAEGSNLYYTNSRVESLVDSSYVQARQTTTGGGSGIDSATSVALTTATVDSAYVQARQNIINREHG